MEKAERETHDFMNVESFSQLPFIRPAPVKEKAIRLFGIEFSGGGRDRTAGAASAAPDDSAESSETNEDAVTKDSEATGDNNRRFECHYCCRNFPTSQALGGHQNAHKRERQHAKRAHLQSTIAQSSLSEAHLYGHLMNYKTVSAAGPNHPVAMSYPPWSSHSHHHLTRIYSGHSSGYSVQQPINGSPLGWWRTSAVNGSAAATIPRERSLHPLPLFAGEDLRPSPGGGSSSSQGRYGYESKPSVQDHPSLDLHL